uniref:Tail assembly chaperone protein n=1 Tax=Siphoviridae sp. ctulf7 TaxID=2826505 RepID=A0A8S5M5Q5_9CAUD|nr:MAG TPA: tail assembly chaperone protein [Siphoviridae sp. ctulf7]
MHIEEDSFWKMSPLLFYQLMELHAEKLKQQGRMMRHGR